MYGLVLEGGGTRGAFHMGAVKALLENGYAFGGVAGTSIGAFNAAIIAQGDFEHGYHLWQNMTTAMLLDIEEEQVNKFLNREIDREFLMYSAKKAWQIISNRGLDVSRIRKMLDENIDEEKLRESGMDFGIVTVSVSDLMPLELFKEDIPKGKLIDYLIASAYLPAFRMERIDGKFMIDGGFYNNLPVNLMVKKGYTDIIAIRTFGMGKIRPVEDEKVNVTYIEPSEKLGRVLSLDKRVVARNLKMGYMDTMRMIKGLKGVKYYIEPMDDAVFVKAFSRVPPGVREKLAALFDLGYIEGPQMMTERILPTITHLMGAKDSISCQDIAARMLEALIAEGELERYRIYTFSALLSHVKREIPDHIDYQNLLGSKIGGIGRIVSKHIRESMLRIAACEIFKTMPENAFGKKDK